MSSALVFTHCEGESDALKERVMRRWEWCCETERVSYKLRRRGKWYRKYYEERNMHGRVSWSPQHKTANRGSHRGRNEETNPKAAESSDEGWQEMPWKGNVWTYFLGKTQTMFHFVERHEE